MLKKLSLVVGAVVLLAACGASTSEESEAVGAVEGAITGEVCGSNGCGLDAHPAALYCTTSCYPYVCGSSPNATLCETNTTLYWQCDSTECDPGYHIVERKCDPTICGPVDCASNPGWYNMAKCEKD